MQRSKDWWATLSDEQQEAILAMPQYDLESWVLDSMAAAGIELAEAEMNGRVVRLAPTMTSDFIAAQRH